MLTIIDYSAVSGINGVAWDAVELPSQFLEYFVWEKLVLDQSVAITKQVKLYLKR